MSSTAHTVAMLRSKKCHKQESVSSRYSGYKSISRVKELTSNIHKIYHNPTSGIIEKTLACIAIGLFHMGDINYLRTNVG